MCRLSAVPLKRLGFIQSRSASVVICGASKNRIYEERRLSRPQMAAAAGADTSARHRIRFDGFSHCSSADNGIDPILTGCCPFRFGMDTPFGESWSKSVGRRKVVIAADDNV